MKYIVSWSLPHGTYNAAAARFLQTKGMPPEGVKLIGRWHGMNGAWFAVAETTDAKALDAWVVEWSDLIPIQATPCLEDAEAGEVLQSARAGRPVSL
jgi:hypothetical protein